jgi:arylsulfatase A-like enzyme
VNKQPNIVLIQSDDHARWALPIYGGSTFHAPNIDRLAARGVVMENAFTPTPVCSPARGSTMTGLTPSQHGIRDFISSKPRYHEKNWLEGLDTISQLLSAQGYYCGLAGKWHLGMDRIPAKGFDEWRAMSGAYPITHQGSQEFSINGTITRVDGVLSEITTDHALNILENRPDKNPFFLYVGYYATHSPWSGHPDRLVPQDEPGFDLDDPPAGYQALNVELRDSSAESRRAARAQYRAAVAEIDECVGRILAALPKDEDTIIIYTADHGLSVGQHGLFGKGNATYPQNLFNDHIRIPMIISRPGVWPEGERCPHLVDLTDLYTMLTSATGVAGSETDGKVRGGRDIMGITKGETPPKVFQACEYGPYALYFDGETRFERRAGQDVEPCAEADALEAFYRSLNCAPPWEWQPPEEHEFNPTDAWLPPD